MSTQTIGSLSGWASLPPEILIKNIVPYLDQDPAIIARMELVCRHWCEALRGGKPQESPVFDKNRISQNMAAGRYEESAVKTNVIGWKQTFPNVCLRDSITVDDPVHKIQYTSFHQGASTGLKINVGAQLYNVPLDIGNSIIGLGLMNAYLVIHTGYSTHFFKRLTENNMTQLPQLKKINSLYSLVFTHKLYISSDETRLMLGKRIFDFASPNARSHRWDKLVKMARAIACLFQLVLLHIILTAFALITSSLVGLSVIGLLTLPFIVSFLDTIQDMLKFCFELILNLTILINIIVLCPCLYYSYKEMQRSLRENPYYNLRGFLS
jgi:hypothetical protein